MLDVRWIRENPQALVEALVKRQWQDGEARSTVDDIVAKDEARRAHLAKLQAAQERRNAASKEIGKAMAVRDGATADALKAEVANLKGFIQDGEATERTLDKDLADALAVIPNVPLDDVPVGKDEHDNVELRRVGDVRPRPNWVKEHFEIGEALGLMDFERAAKLSGARFTVLKGQLARLERALGQFMLDLHTTEHGYEEVQPPLLVRDEVLFGTNQLPKFEDDLFFVPHSGARLGLIPTAEVPLTNLVREEIVAAESLPRRYTALTPCFRSEAGSAGKDTRGMLRQHQFYKVELVSITDQDSSLAEHDRMTACAEEVLKRLDLPFRTMVLSSGDMGFGARKTHDIEVWLPGQNAYREISSCSVCGDFQARRMDARYRSREDKATRFVHTLNGSGVALGRALIAVLENYQNEDGSVTIPDVLVPYMGGLNRIELEAGLTVRILLTNDDGIHAEGLAVLERIAGQLSDDVWVVAPEFDQSGFAHSLSLSDPLRLRKIGERRYAVRGTPTDCIIMGCRHVLPELPDLVLSGVNAGSNTADDVTYSGTVAGAMEGALVGVRSIALSQAYIVRDEERVVPWETAEALAPALLDRLIRTELPRGVFLNVNFPNCAPEQAGPALVTAQGRLTHALWVEQRADGRGLPYYWLRFGREAPRMTEGTDMAALRDNRISVTPLQLDLTAHEVMGHLAKALA